MNSKTTNIEEVDLGGFLQVSGDMFSHPTERRKPAMTIWRTAISFSVASFELLNYCDNIRMHINSDKKQVLITPTTDVDRDRIHWIKKVKGKPQIKKMKCVGLTEPLYLKWNLDNNKMYRATGRLVTADNKVMLLFDFSRASEIEVKKRGK